MERNFEPSKWNRSNLGDCLVVSKAKKSAPFIVQRRDCILRFPEGHEFEGAEIRAKLDVDVGTFLQFQRMGEEGVTTEEQMSVFSRFGDDIVLEWNLHDEDAKPVPSNGDGFLSLPPTICIAIIGAWAEQAGSSGEV